ncbi:MAG TPA: ATP-dependent sacrificial sulfur transferase LarE [Spirochaetes bacterium]|nr:ATP-dependent sacrificial sulfur transferase LarE [Spirochaetota bacterium]
MGAGAGPKLERLRSLLAPLDGALLAYSGGVDSALLLRVAHEALGDRLLTVTVRSELFSDRELDDARGYAAALGAHHEIIHIALLREASFIGNPRDRCYGCKKIIFTRLLRLAGERGLSTVLEGSNIDDEKVFRPGLRALEELAVRSPLKETGLSKEEVRALAKDLVVPGWDRPSRPCLATRFPYGAAISPEALERVKRAEEYLYSLGFREFRVRDHGELARIETGKSETALLNETATAAAVVLEFKKLGFVNITLDLQGLRSGSWDGDGP